MTDIDGYRAVMRVVQERPEWIPAVQAALVCSLRAAASPYPGEEFAGAWVLDELARQQAERTWYPNLRLLVSYGVLEKSGPSTRQKQRAYYRIPDPEGVGNALKDLGRPAWSPTSEKAEHDQ